MLNLLLLALWTVTALWHFSKAPKGENRLLAVAGEEDEDIKIAPGSFTASQSEERLSEAEAEALAYMKQKQAGNVDKARELGVQFARILKEQSDEVLPELDDPAEQLRAHHQLLLYSYAVNRVIGDLSPNSILAQTALNVFYDALEDSALDVHMRDMAAFSLYILCERSEICMEDEIGKIYAKLCGQEGQKAMIDEGNSLYREFYLNCSRLHEATRYVEV